MFNCNGYRFSNRMFFTMILIAYHLVFLYIFNHYLSLNGGDANLYWFQTSATDGYTWSQLFFYGNRLMCWFNYPFAVLLRLPIWVGHVLYGFIGLLGIFQFYKLLKSIVGESLVIQGYNVLPLVVFMPNLHFWTAGISKEVLCFYAITTIFLQIQIKQVKSLAFFASCALLVGLRPHVALLLITAIGVVYLWRVPLSRKRKYTYSLLFTILIIALYLLVCNMMHINPFDWERWLLNNKNWRDSFIGSGSYVSITTWNFPYQFFSFYFRPLFYDIHHLYSWILSIENLGLLGLYLVATFQLIRHRIFKTKNILISGMVLLNILACLVYMQRYAGLGIFVRTKVMFQPFMVIALLYILVKTIPQLHQHDKA